MLNNYSYLVVRPPPKVKTQILKATSAISYQLSAISYQLSAYRLGHRLEACATLVGF
ncbi:MULTISPECIES: hypothetical protein [unclassified Moorena]|uniref:hypothetical protein n=1 Tax=unclassified Moorena TaxID=2683338 RepID=UPI0013FF93B7|nr:MULTISPECIES: hypothetical protein [unclassified Moorena]NEO15781.1 hypothetical protein [Moorena sp. SIO3E8]NEQ02230.1 hypothetical protein [Moorena sp. SIO3F7]